jgi:hypothetical protein
MTPAFWARAFIALLCTITAVWVFGLMRRRRREGNVHAEDQTRRMFWILASCALTLTLSIDPLGRRLGNSVGQPFLPDHLKHLILLCTFVHAIAGAENLSGSRSRHRLRSRAQRLRMGIWPLVAAAMFVCYLLSPSHYDLLEVENGLGGWTGTAYWTLFMGYALVITVPFALHCLRFVRASRTVSAERAGIAALGLGGLSCITYALCKLAVVAIESGEKLRNLLMASSRLAIFVAFVTICYGCWRSRGQNTPAWFDWWTARVTDLTQARWLRPMSTAMHKAAPDADVELAVLDPELILATRENTTRDGIAELAPWMDPRDFAMIRETLATQRDDEALILTTAVELARRRMLDGLSPLPVTPGSPQDDDGPMLQRMAAAWPAALDLADAVEADYPQVCPQQAAQHLAGDHVAR